MTKESNPWKLLEVKPIYDNHWIKVEEDQVIKPSGAPGIYGRVHMKNKAVGIIPLDHEQHTWLVGQYRYTLNEYSWEIPTGGAPIEDDLLLSAQRELKEETGLKAKKWDQLLRIHTSNSITDEEGFVFLARDLSKGSTNFDDTEVISIRRLPFAEVVKMVMEEKITDSLSIAGILKLARRLNV